MSVTRFYDLNAKSGRGDAMAKILSDIAEAVGIFAGFEAIDVLRDRADADRFLLVERWESAQAHGAALKALPPELVKQLSGELAGPLDGSYLDTIKSL